MTTKSRVFILISLLFILVILFFVIEFLIIKNNGTPVAAPHISRDPQTIGNGAPLTYVVLGDSTSVSQGSAYRQGYAMASAKHLAHNHQVTFVNFGVSGARAQDVLDHQLAQTLKYKPDVVLIGVGANDATHFTSSHALQTSLQQTIDMLRQSNCKVRIIVTGAPAMDSVPRFPWPAKQLMGLRTKQVNAVFANLIGKNNLTFAPIASQTRQAFLDDPTLFASDKFHPNSRGYALWIPIINHALDQSIQKPLSACKA